MHEIPPIDTAGLRKFGITTGIAFVVLFGAFFPWLFDAGYPLWPWVILAVLASFGLIAPDLLRPVYTGWMRLALLLSKITTPIILGIVFYLVILPMGFVKRIFGKDSMARQLTTTSQTYRVKSKKAAKDSIERPF